MKRLLAVITVMTLFLTACGGDANDDKKDLVVLRLNEVVHSIFYAPQYVALEKGFFEDEGLKIEMAIGQGADKSMTALLSNSADVALLGCEAGLYVYNEGKEDYPKSFAQLTQCAGNFLVSRIDEPDFKWENLKGKVIIGGRAGGMPQMILEYILKDHGLTPGVDVEVLTNLQFETTAGAFASGVGDYTVEFEPTASALVNSGSGFIVDSLGTGTDYIPYTVYMTTDKMINEKPELIEKFTNAIYKGQQWVNSHTSEEIAEVVLTQFPDSDIDTLTQIIDRYKSQGTWRETPDFDEEAFNLIQDILIDGGTLTDRVPYTDLIDNTFALKSMEGK